MPTPTNARSKPRAPLSRERVLRAAVQLADKHGIASLSMRSLARTLRVEAMSLYNHVANKADLIDGMVDLFFAEIGLPATEVGWKTAMRVRAISIHKALARHTWAIRLMEFRNRPGLATLQHHDAVIGCLREAGFSVAMAAHSYSVLDSYIFGFTLHQTGLPVTKSGEAIEVAESILRQYPASAYPHLTEMTVEHYLRPGYDHADEFKYGLELILDALETAAGQRK